MPRRVCAHGRSRTRADRLSFDQRSQALVQAIRNTPPGSGITILVDGGTAGDIDYVNSLYTDFPKAVLIVALTTYSVLLLLFRSLVLPLKAILMNTLSILASYGAIVVIFQNGFLHQVLGFTPLGFVEASSPILLFFALFGLSMDYEVFLLSRVQEAFWQTGDNTRAVALGLQRSGGIITSAALIVIVVSAAFATADEYLVDLKNVSWRGFNHYTLEETSREALQVLAKGIGMGLADAEININPIPIPLPPMPTLSERTAKRRAEITALLDAQILDWKQSKVSYKDTRLGVLHKIVHQKDVDFLTTLKLLQKR